MALVKDAFGKERAPARSNPAPAKPAATTPAYKPASSNAINYEQRAEQRAARASSSGASAGSSYAGGNSYAGGSNSGASANDVYTPPMNNAYTPPSSNAINYEQQNEQIALMNERFRQQQAEAAENLRVRLQQERENQAAEAAQSWRATQGSQYTQTQPPSRAQQVQQYLPLLSQQLQALQQQVANEKAALMDSLNESQRELWPLLSKLPADFPAHSWDTMHPKKQLSIIQKTDLTREEQWAMLNAKPSIRTLRQIMDLVQNQQPYGMTSTELLQAVQQLNEFGNQRTYALNHEGPFYNDRARNLFLKYLEEKETEMYTALRQKLAQTEILSVSLGKTKEAWYNAQRENTTENVPGLIFNFPAIRDMMNVCELSNQQIADLQKVQKKLNILLTKSNVTQKAVDNLLAEACNIMLDKQAIDAMLLYERKKNEDGDWRPDKSLPQEKVYAYTDAIDDLFGKAARWASTYNTIAKIAAAVGTNPTWTNSSAVVAAKAAQWVDLFIKVLPAGAWDVKNAKSWEKTVQSGHEDTVGDLHSSSYRFIYCGELMSAQQLGNVLYGYAGAAAGIPKEALFLGGGFVQNADDNGFALSKWDLRRSHLYGDTEEDRAFIEKGVRMFQEEE